MLSHVLTRSDVRQARLEVGAAAAASASRRSPAGRAPAISFRHQARLRLRPSRWTRPGSLRSVTETGVNRCGYFLSEIPGRKR